MNRPRVIALTGLANAGKTTAARFLEENYGYRRVRFAGPLKAMLRAIGCTEAEVDGAHKERPSELLCGKTPREAMQTLGTEWGRECIGKDLWLKAWVLEACRNPLVVVDDVRFPNEARIVHELGGVIWNVTRPNTVAMDHASERHTLPCDGVIPNNWSVEDLHEAIQHMLGQRAAAFAVKVPAELDPTDGA